jgi:hypothetical protein
LVSTSTLAISTVPFHLGGELVEHRTDLLAWAAPRGPEVHQHGTVEALMVASKLLLSRGVMRVGGHGRIG